MTKPSNPLTLQAILDNTPKSHHDSIKHAFELGKRTAQTAHQNATREALRDLFRLADMSVENEPK